VCVCVCVCVCVSVREPGGGLKLYCKGADMVILERLVQGCPCLESIESALEVSYVLRPHCLPVGLALALDP